MTILIYAFAIIALGSLGVAMLVLFTPCGHFDDDVKRSNDKERRKE